MNPNPAILRVLADAGCQILCGNEAELRLSRYADIDGAQMIYAPMAEDAHAGAYARRIGAAYLAGACSSQRQPRREPANGWADRLGL